MLSSHNFAGMTRDLAGQLRAMRGATAGDRQSRGHAAASGRLRAAAGAGRRGFARQPDHA